MDFNHAIHTFIAELTPQPWDYTDHDETTLTVIPAGLREDPGCAEVTIRIAVSPVQASETGVKTADMPALLDALDTRTAWEHEMPLGYLTITPHADGGMVLTVTEMTWTTSSPDSRQDITASVYLPEAQRLPLASALRRALDVARAWED